MLENMVRILAVKNIRLNQKLAFISRRTIRQKLLSYLSEQALEQESRSFSIPFSRQELADFLCADRSACRQNWAGSSGGHTPVQKK